jgi:hypothetical protein
MYPPAVRMKSILGPVHRWIWRDAERRAQKLLRFAETEADGGRDLVRAAETTSDSILRRLYLVHALDEQRHAELFRRRGWAILRDLPSSSRSVFQANWISPGERGLDDLRVDNETDDGLLAFLHLSEKAAAASFTAYRNALQNDPATGAVFDAILHDETFHMNYTLSQLTRVSPEHHGWRLWRARTRRFWNFYVRLASGIAGWMGTIVLTVQYFVLLPPFVWLAKRAQRREQGGWTKIPQSRSNSLKSQY